MKHVAMFLAAAGVAAAQSMAGALPTCATECLNNGIESATDCALDDGACICEVDNYRNTYDASQACILQACGPAASLDEVLPAAARFCSEVTGGATAPPVDETPSSTGMASSSTSPTSASSTTAPTETATEPTETSEPAPEQTTDSAPSETPSATATPAPGAAARVRSVKSWGVVAALGVIAAL